MWRWRSWSLQISSCSASTSVGPHRLPSRTLQRDPFTFCFWTGQNSSWHPQFISVLSFHYKLRSSHSYLSFPSLHPGVWTTKLFPFLTRARDSRAVTEKAPPFATALTCFASRPSLTTSICTAPCSCVSQTTTSPARLWARLTLILGSLKRLKWQ